MKQRGRQSKPELGVVSTMPDRRPVPPPGLTKEQEKRWRDIVQTKPAEWWDAGSMPLLKEYVRLADSVDELAEVLQRAEDALKESGTVRDAYKDLVRIIDVKLGRLAQLATKMRLTQQSRYDAQKAAVHTKREGDKAAKPVWAVD